MSKLEDFNGSEKSCPNSDVGYHCHYYDKNEECCICGRKRTVLNVEDTNGN